MLGAGGVRSKENMKKEKEITLDLFRVNVTENENVTFAGRYNKGLRNQSAKSSAFKQEWGDPGLLCCVLPVCFQGNCSFTSITS